MAGGGLTEALTLLSVTRPEKGVTSAISRV
jgi:hypothetical protein